VIERKALVVSRIIPGNWGKVEPGWLARPLLDRIAWFGGGGRIGRKKAIRTLRDNPR
jgi:hypothetical protein